MFNFQKLQTKTGIPVYVMPLPHAQSVAAGVFVKAGTRDEQWPEEAGLAHALEHMSFQGTKSFPTSKDVSAYLEEIGGYHNAWTSSEGTFYHNRVPVTHKDRAFISLGEILNEPLIPQEKIGTEMKNIIEELRMYMDNPDSFLSILNQKFLFGDHPLGKNELGTIEALSKFTRNHFLEFRKRYYHASNYTFIITGNITPDEALAGFETNFPQADFQPANNRLLIPLVEKPDRTYVHKKELEQVHVALSAPIGQGKEKPARSIQIFTVMLSGGASFPLFQEVRDKRGLCYSIHAGTSRNSDVGEFSINIGTDPKRYQEAIDVSLDVVRESKNDEPLLAKAKDMMLGSLALQFEHTGGILESAAFSTLFDGQPKGYDELMKEIQEITIDDVTSAVDMYLKPEDMRKVLLVPNELEIK